MHDSSTLTKLISNRTQLMKVSESWGTFSQHSVKHCLQISVADSRCESDNESFDRTSMCVLQIQANNTGETMGSKFPSHQKITRSQNWSETWIKRTSIFWCSIYAPRYKRDGCARVPGHWNSRSHLQLAFCDSFFFSVYFPACLFSFCFVFYEIVIIMQIRPMAGISQYQ